MTKNMYTQGGAGGIYFFAMVGAAIYYIQQSSTFWDGVLGVLKGIAWPGMLIYKAFHLLNM